MTYNPNDKENNEKAYNIAIAKERTRASERTPDASKNNNGKYPMRNSTEYPGGHKLTFDSTPESRIVEIAHGSGTFQQWSEDGTEIKIVVGNAHHHMKEGYTMTINENGDIFINGHARVSVGGGAHIEIRGDASLVVTGDMTQFVAGNYNLAVGGNYNVSTGKAVNMTAGSDMTQKVRGQTKIDTGGKMTLHGDEIHLNP